MNIHLQKAQLLEKEQGHIIGVEYLESLIFDNHKHDEDLIISYALFVQRPQTADYVSALKALDILLKNDPFCGRGLILRGLIECLHMGRITEETQRLYAGYLQYDKKRDQVVGLIYLVKLQHYCRSPFSALTQSELDDCLDIGLHATKLYPYSCFVCKVLGSYYEYKGVFLFALLFIEKGMSYIQNSNFVSIIDEDDFDSFVKYYLFSIYQTDRELKLFEKKITELRKKIEENSYNMGFDFNNL